MILVGVSPSAATPNASTPPLTTSKSCGWACGTANDTLREERANNVAAEKCMVEYDSDERLWTGCVDMFNLSVTADFQEERQCSEGEDCLRINGVVRGETKG